ncbi:hypothetical protein CBR_g23679 [Chara braunii]|uniref:Uncharacterized protein n=1 Tax=Chara braunii TaxID=69332 RepID=A0A388L4X2_CHABU|nr:hypothetical protein CBR_g23679 [Chara braunii]|eukprot:GBG77347.1 hypothetical protein CBR_g23679 [Chara braunii]
MCEWHIHVLLHLGGLLAKSGRTLSSGFLSYCGSPAWFPALTGIILSAAEFQYSFLCGSFFCRAADRRLPRRSTELLSLRRNSS